MTIISPENINNATNAVSILDTPELRKKAYISLLSVSIVSEYLKQSELIINTENSFYNNSLLLNEFNFADMQAQDVKIDIRTSIGSDYSQMLIPKSHFSYAFTPDVYVGLRISREISDSDILGFIEAEKINRFSGKNKDYIIIEKEQLTPLSELTSYVSNFKKKKNSFTSLSHEKAKNLFFSYIDGEISRQDKVYLLKHIAKCEECAKEFNVYLGLDKHFSTIRKIPKFLTELPFENKNNAIEVMQDSIGGNNSIKLVMPNIELEKNLDIIYNTAEAASLIASIGLFDKIKNTVVGRGLKAIPEVELPINEAKTLLVTSEVNNEEVYKEISLYRPEQEIADVQYTKEKKRTKLTRKFKKAVNMVKKAMKPVCNLELPSDADENLIEETISGNSENYIDEFNLETQNFDDYSLDNKESQENPDLNIEGKTETFDELFADVTEQDFSDFANTDGFDDSCEEVVLDPANIISEYEISGLTNIQELTNDEANIDDFQEIGNLEDYLMGKVIDTQDIVAEQDKPESQDDFSQVVPKIELIIDDKISMPEVEYHAKNTEDDGKIFKNLARKLREEDFSDDNFEVKELPQDEIQNVNLNLSEAGFVVEDIMVEGFINDTDTLQDLLGVRDFVFNEEKVKELSEKFEAQGKEGEGNGFFEDKAEADRKIQEILDSVEIIGNLQELSRLSGNFENQYKNPEISPQENTEKLPQEFANFEKIVKNDDKKVKRKDQGKNAGLIVAAAVITAAGMLAYIGMNVLKPVQTNISNKEVNIAQNPQPTNYLKLSQQEQVIHKPVPQKSEPVQQQIPLSEIKTKKMTEFASNKNMNDVLANAFINQGNEIKITNVSWEIKPSLASQVTFKNYLIVTGQVLKMSLSKNLLATNDRASINKIKVKVILAPNGSIQESNIKETSGSKQIDEIVLTTLKETFAYTKMPVNLNFKDPITTNVVINL